MSSNVRLFTLLALNLPEECHVCGPSESLEERILWLWHSQFLSRNAQLALAFVEQIGILVEASHQRLPRTPATKSAEREDGTR